ncbi:MAG: thioredoxin [bacterium]|nr:thioredoxin [Candidatus Minthenecus merdequi]
MKKILLSLIVMTSFLLSYAQEQKVQIKHITKAEFLEKVWNYEANPNEWKYEGKLPCIVDFYASWCGPCKRLAPILEELQQEYKGKIIIYKVNTETERELAGAFGIQSIPTLLFCPKNGKPSISKGLLPKETLQKAIETNLLKQK